VPPAPKKKKPVTKKEKRVTTTHHKRDDNLWNIRLGELSEYKERHGDCNVPIRSTENQQLARWVKAQRKYYQHWLAGKRSSLTVERRQALDSIGFNWVLRPYGGKKKREKKDEKNAEIEHV
jgi:hypothetical protein